MRRWFTRALHFLLQAISVPIACWALGITMNLAVILLCATVVVIYDVLNDLFEGLDSRRPWP